MSSGAVWYSVAMGRPVVLIVLALLMLQPSGVCACDATEHGCPDHPTSTSVGGSEDGPDSAKIEHDPRPAGLELAHRCPPPQPHHPACPAVTAETASKVSQCSSQTGVATPPALPLFFVRVAPECRTHPARTAPVRLSSPPLYLAHCVLII